MILVNTRTMAGVALGNILGAVTGITAAVSSEDGVKQFIDTIHSYGLQVKNNFEVNFSGLESMKFFVNSITIPGMKMNTAEIYYNGRQVSIPVNIDYDHDFNMTVLCDASSVIYPALVNVFMDNSVGSMINGGYTVILKALTGDSSYTGLNITMRGVQLTSLGGLNFGQSANEVATFDLGFKCLDFSITSNGTMGTISNVMTAVDNIFG